MPKRKKLDYKPMPEPVSRRMGCKVGWYYYRTEAEARAASPIAVHNGRIAAGEGYDFGYCCPGSVEKLTSDAPHGRPELKGLWEVCVS